MVRAQVRLVTLAPRSPRALLDAAEALALGDGQERFVLPPAATLPDALADPDRVPFAVLTTVGAGEVVGYGVLDRRGYLGHLLDQAERTVLLRGYCVAAPVQGRGYGAAGARAARALAAQVAPSADLVVLSVDQANDPGLRAYTRAGFVDTGARYEGRSGTEVVMAATARAAPPVVARRARFRAAPRP